MLKSKFAQLGISAVLFWILLVVWVFVIIPNLTAIPNSFSYRADVESLDNFYNEARAGFQGEQMSKTVFSYRTDGRLNNVLNIRNLFDVRQQTGTPIFNVERRYAIDRQTGKHVTGYGDRDRDGYLFAPRHLDKGTSFTYWHVNYDTPAKMVFQGEERLDGLTVYRYTSTLRADQTANLDRLPGVPEQRGVNLDVSLQTWVEPVTGRLVKYEDQAQAWYYDIETRERLVPWNKFRNEYTPESIAEQVRLAKEAKSRQQLVEWVIPLVLGLVALLLTGLALRRYRNIRARISGK